MGLSVELDKRGLSGCTIWARVLPSCVSIARSNSLVLRAVLSLSAAHLACLTQNPEIDELSRRHRSAALKGLQAALSPEIVAVSRENAEAMISVHILLLWQVTDYHTWIILKRGLATILETIPPVWKQESLVIQYGESQGTLNSLKFSLSIDEHLAQLDCAMQTLRLMQERVQHHADYSHHLRNLIDLVQRLRQTVPCFETPEQFFDETKIFRKWLLWLPSYLLRDVELEMSGLAVLAQFFAVATILDRIYPQTVGSTYGTVSITAIEEICRVLAIHNATDLQSPDLKLALTLLELPRYCVARHHGCLSWSPLPSVEPYPSDLSSPSLGLADNCFASHSSPRSISSSYAAHTPPLQSPAAGTIVESSYITPHVYSTPAESSYSFYPPSPHVFDTQNLQPDASSASYFVFDPHLSFYTPPLASDTFCSEMPSTHSMEGLQMPIYHSSYAFEMPEMAPSEPCWT
ncbi:hypothetical protein POX_c03953 [Penicillium oxalicum]|uniref:hypothetical protein n=1 Tax=Penicillium oxalicum TaxID=69781 RepID=UPI0020B7A415|nr:hypothetical protein POX_c03953 [Penicillium oxalicum]KAI2791098.1 hypothetical protein POX_c03953 [Penicillium oxalicum]